MRIYEYAKKHGLSSKDLIVELAAHGMTFASHMAVLSDPAIALLNKKYLKEIEPISKSETKSEPTQKTQAKHPAAPQASPPVAKSESSNVEKKVINQSISQQGPKAVTITPTKPVEEKKEPVISITLKPQTLHDFSIALSKPSSEIILTLLKWGILSNKNQLLNEELVGRLAEHYGAQAVRSVEVSKIESKVATGNAVGAQLQQRLPVVVVMGHVDHGKTTLLDFIRKTRVASREKGGITQHLGAYEAKTPQGNLVFIDTPGHEAFSKIRIRGTKVADIVILVVAADDGIMPQTIEALKHAQSMQVPIIVAINKIDKVDKARIDVVKRDLATQHNLLPEEWGGQTMYLPISAKTGAGVDKLLELILLQSEVMELKTEVTGPALGFVLESKLEKGRGPVATILSQKGIFSVGDYFVAGKTTGKISSIVDSFGNRQESVLPSHPVQVAGFNELPEAGDTFEVLDKDVYLKTKNIFSGQKNITQRSIQSEASIVLLVKTDTNSSKEALLESIAKLTKKNEKGFLVLQSAIGNVNESDVMLAADTGAKIVTLHVKVEPNAALLAQRNGVTIATFDIIYKLLESLQSLSESMIPVKMVRTKVGEAVVRKVFDIKNLGVIAGSYLKTGIFSRDGFVVVWRGARKVGEGKITSLQRDKHAVKEVHAGYECGFMVENMVDWQIDDRVECFLERPEVKK